MSFLRKQESIEQIDEWIPAFAGMTAIEIFVLKIIMSNVVEIFTDGACSGNPGPGGWGAIMRYGDVEKELSGGESDTTNNRMEMMAAIAGLEALKKSSKVKIYTDSKYLQQGVSEWMEGWKKKGWPAKIKNQDLWKRIDVLLEKHDVKFVWIKGHAGHPENERADVLATGAIKRKNN